MFIVLPILMFLASVAIFFGYIYPSYPEVKQLRFEAAQFDEALSKTEELRSVRDALSAVYATFSEEDLKRLAAMLPSEIDNVQLALDLDSIAARHGLQISSFMLTSGSEEASELQQGAAGIQLAPSTVNFHIEGDYRGLVNFLKDVERSLRIVDVTQLSFDSSEEVTTYAVQVRVYALK